MLNAHPQIAVPPESRFVIELYESSDYDEVEVEGILARLEAHRRFQLWQLSIEDVRRELGQHKFLPYARVMEGAFRAYARARDKSRWGDKTPRYVEHIALLARLFPSARFVHQIRDGRDVALSYADVPFGPKSVARAAHLWARRVRSGIEAGRALGPERYAELRYEDLVVDPEAHARRLCGFLGVPFDDGMMDHARRARSDILERAARYNPHLTERPAAQLRSWEREMSPSQVAVFEAVAGELLSQLGYPRAAGDPSAGTRVAAALGRLGAPVGRLRKTRRPEA